MLMLKPSVEFKGIEDNKFKKWMAECLHIHCRSPWTLLALLGALFAIILTGAQTYLAANPPKT